MLFVKKLDWSLKFCVDYRALNGETIGDKYLLPNHKDVTDQLAGAKHLSSLDLRSGYW